MLTAPPRRPPIWAKGAAKRVATDPVVVIETNKGTIKVEVFKKDAPVSSENFLDLVGKGFYNGLTFHRVEPGFVIQGGDPQGTGMGNYVDPKTGSTRYIRLETKPELVHEKGSLAMARSSNPNSASCQFYITLDAQPALDGKYAVFGKVLEGQNVVEAIRVGDKMTKVAVAAEGK
ncbi:MAG: peptidylprolyl isomerase [Candidatus Obscuribacter sp.]|nr:peptidylprolyl isomerase [Candidatus Obscuribacter sp.]